MENPRLLNQVSPVRRMVSHPFEMLSAPLSQEALVHVGVWCLGEFGDLLVSGQALGPDDRPISVTPGGC